MTSVSHTFDSLHQYIEASSEVGTLIKDGTDRLSFGRSAGGADHSIVVACIHGNPNDTCATPPRALPVGIIVLLLFGACCILHHCCPVFEHLPLENWRSVSPLWKTVPSLWSGARVLWLVFSRFDRWFCERMKNHSSGNKKFYILFPSHRNMYKSPPNSVEWRTHQWPITIL